MTDKTTTIDRNLTSSSAGRREQSRARPWKPVFPLGRLVAVAENLVLTTATMVPKARVLTLSTATQRRRLEVSNDRMLCVSEATGAGAGCVAQATQAKKYAPAHKVFFTRKRIAL